MTETETTELNKTVPTVIERQQAHEYETLGVVFYVYVVHCTIHSCIVYHLLLVQVHNNNNNNNETAIDDGNDDDDDEDKYEYQYNFEYKYKYGYGYGYGYIQIHWVVVYYLARQQLQ